MQKIFDRHELFHDAAHATDGQPINDLFRENRSTPDELSDLIFLDFHMHCFKGFDFMEAFEKLYLSFQKPISIYIVSSLINENERKRTFSYPFVRDFLTMPVKKDILQQIYATYFKTNRKLG